jgi:hypothetical protein
MRPFSLLDLCCCRYRDGLLLPANGAVSTYLEPRHNDVKAAISFQLVFQCLESLADKLSDLPAPETCHVDMIAAQLALVEMAFAVQMHEVEFIDQTLSGIQMFVGGLDHA